MLSDLQFQSVSFALSQPTSQPNLFVRQGFIISWYAYIVSVSAGAHPEVCVLSAALPGSFLFFLHFHSS